MSNKNYDGQTLECNLKVEIPIRLQGITFLVDCYKDNRMQGNGHYDILLGNCDAPFPGVPLTTRQPTEYS